MVRLLAVSFSFIIQSFNQSIRQTKNQSINHSIKQASMQAATVDSPRWTVSIDQPTGPGTEPKAKPAYYWTLNDVNSVPAFDPPRFYLMKSLNSDLWFIPQGYMDLYVRSIPFGRRFPEVGLNMCDAYGLDGKPMEKIVKTKAELSAMVTDAQDDIKTAASKLSENLVSYNADYYGFQ